jgi:hypothetical protein
MVNPNLLSKFEMVEEVQFNYNFLNVIIIKFKSKLLDKNQLWSPKEGYCWTKVHNLHG